MNRSNRLETHFALCAVAVTVTAVVASTNAAVVQWDCNVVVPANIDGIYFNLELQTFGTNAATTAGWDINPYSATGLVWYNAAGTGMMRFPGVTTGSAGNLAAGTVVSSTASLTGSGAVVFGGAPGNWVLGQDNLFAFQFRTAADGTTGVHYGYGIMAVGATASDRMVRSLFYESVAGAPITISGGGPPPNYDPCAAFNPVASLGSNSFYLNQTTAANLAVTGSCSFTAYKANYFKFIAPSTGDFIIDTCASNADTRLAVLNGCAAGAAVLKCNDDTCGLSSRVVLSAVAQQTYYIVVGGASASVDLPSPTTVRITAVLTNPANNHVYAVFTTTSWSAAEATSVALGGHLVTINDSAENDWIQQNFGLYGGIDRRLWIGFNDVAVEGSFVWASGEPASFTNWNAGEPNNSGATEHYAELLGSNGKWNDLNLAGSGLPHLGIAELGVSVPPCPADFDGDRIVGGSDLAVILSNWLGSGNGDLDGDNLVNGSDLTTLLSAWGACP